MQHQLRMFAATLLCVAILTSSACGGSDDGDPSADVPAGADSDPEVVDAGATEFAEFTRSAEPAEKATTDGGEWVPITDEASGFTFEMPEAVEPQVNSTDVGEETTVDLRRYSTVIHNEIEIGFNVIDTPGAEYDFDAGIKGVAGSLDGEIISTTKINAGGNPAVEVEMTYEVSYEMTYEEDYIVFFQLVTGKEHIVQLFASGPKRQRAVVHQMYEQVAASVTGY